MTVSLKHSFTSEKEDSSDASLIQPSNWNAEHSLTCASGILIGRATAGTGSAEEIGLGSGLSFSGGNLVVSGFASSSHTHVIADVTGLQTALDGKQAAGSYQPLATVLTNTTASFTTDQETKLAGIEAGAQADPWTYAFLASNATNSTTTITDTALAFTPEPDSFYEIEVLLFMQAAATTTGPRPGVKFPTAGVTQSAGYMMAPNAATAFITRIWSGTGSQNAATTGIGTANVDQLAEGKFLMQTGSSVTGDFIITLASEIAASEARIMANSFIKYRKIP